ncbi:MAG: hypothetical protein ABI647_19690 [Gemmatimonadota bacterium]
MRKTSRWGAQLLLLGAVVGCSDSPLEPADVVGTYNASEFTVTLNGVPRDVLALGGLVTIVLNSDGTTTGRFTTPAVAGLSTVPVDESMEGTYTLQSSDRVRFVQAASTLITDLFFVYHRGPATLNGSFSFGAPNTGQVVLVLTKQ